MANINERIDLYLRDNGTVEVYGDLDDSANRTMLGEATEYFDITQEQAVDLYHRVGEGAKSTRPQRFVNWCAENGIDFEPFNKEGLQPTVEKQKKVEKSPKERVIEALNRMVNFFKEFDFAPSFRFVNTLSWQESPEAAKTYIRNYFALTDSPYAQEVARKLESREFALILEGFFAQKAKERINKRFAIFFGSAGGGKTTLAMTQTDNRCIVCNSSMSPSDLLEDFQFSDGKPTFQRSTLRMCMEEGLPVVMDELNLLSFESIRFLQTITDGKPMFTYKGEEIRIKEGFKIIATMNLLINGSTYGLPEPLVDRADEIREFVLDANQLYEALN